MVQILHYPNASILGSALAEIIGEKIEIKLRTDTASLFILGCPGGRSPQATYIALANVLAARKINLNRVVIAMMDNYVRRINSEWQHVDSNAHYSCERFAREHIQGVFNDGRSWHERLPDSNIWFPNPLHPESYDRRLQSAGGVDFFILASGSGDGHVAFNPAGTPLDSKSRIVELAQQTRIDNLGTFPDFSSIADVPTHGVTVGTGTISNCSLEAALILSGSDKTLAYKKILATEEYNKDWPSTVIHTIDNSLVLVDDSAIKS